jgi:uncharacterized membrane protein
MQLSEEECGYGISWLVAYTVTAIMYVICKKPSKTYLVSSAYCQFSLIFNQDIGTYRDKIFRAFRCDRLVLPVISNAAAAAYQPEYLKLQF